MQREVAKAVVKDQLEEPSQKLEARVTTLETELAEMKQLLSKIIDQKAPWWLKIAGSCEHDPTFDEAMQLGREWRKSAE